MAMASSAAYETRWPVSGGMTWASSPMRVIFPEGVDHSGRRGMRRSGSTKTSLSQASITRPSPSTPSTPHAKAIIVANILVCHTVTSIYRGA
jgi:hypothetical protein